MSEDKVFYVYEWIRLDTNEPFYVGKGKKDRWFCKQRSEWFTRIANMTDVAVCIIDDNLTEKEALDTEIYYIWYYRDVIGYELTNFTDGGEGISGHRHSKETKLKMSKARLGTPSPMKGKKMPLKSIQQMRESKIGVPSKIKGIPLTEEHKHKLKLNHKGMTGLSHSDGTKLKISMGRKGWNPSEETREKMRNNAIRNNAVSNLEQKRFKKGNIPWNKGRKSTDEERLKLSLAHVGKSIPPEQIEKIRVSTQRTYDNMLKERFPEEYYTNIKTLLKTKMLKKDICEELSITMHHMRRILTVYERD